MSGASRNWFKRRSHDGEVKGKLGLQTSPGVYTFNSPDGRQWVTLENGTVISAINAVVATGVFDVIVKQNEDGGWEVQGLQTQKVWSAVGANIGSVNIPQHTGSTTGPTPEAIETRQLIDGLVYQDASENPLVLTILPFWYETAAGDQARYGGGTIDVTPYLPAGAGTHGWVKVGFDKTGVAPVAEAGTPIAMSVPLTVDDLALIALNGYVPLSGVILSYEQSSAPVEKDFLDCSNIKDSGGGSGSFYQTVEVNDVAQTQRGALDLKAGTNVTLTPTDNSGANRTEVLIDVAGVGYTQGCRVYNSANQAVAVATFVTLSFDSENYDTDTMHDPGTNPSRITIKTAGVYDISGYTELTSGAGDVYANFSVNGSVSICQQTTSGLTGFNTRINLSTKYKFSVNDYVEFVVYQTVGSINSIANKNSFEAQRIG